MNKKIIYLGIIFLLLVVAIIFVITFGKLPSMDGNFIRYELSNGTEKSVPDNLNMPFRISDIDEKMGQINPLGVVRFSKDQAEIGHSGIDIPLRQGEPIYAVGDGPIVRIPLAGDPWGGKGIYQLLQPTVAGEGWLFIYEHVTPEDDFRVGSVVNKGEIIAYKTPPGGFTAHFQMSYAFNNYEFTRAMECWPDYLAEEDYNNLLTWWKEYRESRHLRDSWKTTDEEGKFPFKAFLDTTLYPDGLQLCYPPGTDVR